MLKVLILAGGMLAAGPALALTAEAEPLLVEGEDPASVIQQWRVAYAACEGGTDHNGKTLTSAERSDVCFESDNITEILSSHGFCLIDAKQEWLSPMDAGCADAPSN